VSCLKWLEVRAEYLEATLGLVKRQEISKEPIHECVAVPGCCCCMPLLHNHLMDSISYLHKYIASRQRGTFAPPLPPPKSATGSLYQKKALVFCVAIAMLFVAAKYRTTPQRFEGNCSVHKYTALQHMKVELDTRLSLP